MTIRTYLSIITCLITLNSYSQINIGVKAGLNYSNNVEVTDLPRPDSIKLNKYQYRIGPSIGLYSTFSLNDRIVFTPELIYSLKGYKFDATSYSGKGTLNLHYLNIPLLIGFQFNKLTMSIGPEFGYLIAAISKFDSQTKNNSFYNKKIDFGLLADINLKVTKKIAISARYIHGFTSVGQVIIYRPLDYWPEEFTSKFQNRSYQISILYSLK